MIQEEMNPMEGEGAAPEATPEMPAEGGEENGGEEAAA